MPYVLARRREKLGDVWRSAATAKQSATIDAVRSAAVSLRPRTLKVLMKCVGQALCPLEYSPELLSFLNERKVGAACVDDAARRAFFGVSEEQQMESVVFVQPEVGHQKIWLIDH